MPRITDERREQQRRRIVDAGLAVLLRRGLGGLSMGAVIEESGLSAGAIYGYFAGKDELVAAVARGLLGTRTERLVAIGVQRPVPPPLEAMRDFLGALPRELIASGAVLQIWGEAGHRADLREQATEVLDGIEDAMRAYLEAWFVHGRGLSEPDAHARARRAAPALLALTQGFVAQATLRGGLDVDAYLDGVAAAADAVTAG